MFDNSLDEFEFKACSNELLRKWRGHSLRFKDDGGSADPPSAQIADTGFRKYARRTLYPMVRRALQGKGFGTKASSQQRRQSLRRGLTRSYETAQEELGSTMTRTIPKEDVRVRDFMQSQLERAYVGKKDELKRSFRQERVGDIDLGMGLATDYLAGELRMTTNAAQMYNQAVQRSMIDRQRLGAFETNVASGLGSSMMDYYYAQKMNQ